MAARRRAALYARQSITRDGSASLDVQIEACREVAKRLKPLNGKIVVCALQPSVAEVFEIAGFGSIFQIFGDRQAAVAGVQ